MVPFLLCRFLTFSIQWQAAVVNGQSSFNRTEVVQARETLENAMRLGIIWLGPLSVELRNMIGQFAVGVLTQCPGAITDFLEVLAGKLPCWLKSKNRRELSIFIEVFRRIKRAKKLLLVFCKAVYVKAQQIDMKPV